MALPVVSGSDADSEATREPAHIAQTDGGDLRSPGDQKLAPRHRARRLGSADAIREAAAALFLEKGYQSTSMDEIAAAAQISKQTIYTHFADKEALFADLVLGNVDRVDAFVGDITRTVHEAEDIGTGLRQVARRYLQVVIQPEVLQLRRLVIGESGRFPGLARTYYERVPQRVYSALATLTQELTDEGHLHVIDPFLAAHHFGWLIVGMPMDRGMFYGPDETMTGTELDRVADAAVRVFMAAYGTARTASPDRGG